MEIKTRLKIPYIKKTEELVFEQYPKIWEGLVMGKIFGPSYLRGLVFNYPNTLLLRIQKEYHHALEKGENLITKPSLADYVGELSYLLLRLADNQTIGEIFQRIKNGEEVQVHFGEKFDQVVDEIKRPNARGRRYFEKVDKNNLLHLCFEIRRQTINDPKNPPTDFLELMSLLGFYEMTRYLVKLSIEKPNLLPELEEAKKLLIIINRFLPEDQQWTFDDLKQWATSSGGLYLSNTNLNQGITPLSSLDKKREKDELALYDAVMKIGLKVEEKGLPLPDSIILGNEFTFPLILAIPLLDEDDLKYLSSNSEANKDGKPLDLLPPSIKKEKLDEVTKNTLTRFMYLQFLSRYQGKDQVILEIKKRIFGLLEKTGVKTRIFEANETPLGDPVDYYDFSKLDESYLLKLAETPIIDQVKNTIFDLYTKNKKFLNFSYPLGDNTYGLIEALTELIPEVKNVTFFGKVGATLQWDGENNLGTRVGRVVSPEYVSSINNFNPQKFINSFKSHDILPIIFNADEIEVIFQSEGVLLQTLEDIKKAQRAIIERKDIPYNEKIKLLIDMESFYLYLICQQRNIIPAVIYYTSDNTIIPPLSGKTEESIITSLGPRGSFAVMVAGLSALQKLLF